MHYGDLRMFGPTEEVMAEYRKFIDWFKKQTEKRTKSLPRLIQRKSKAFNLEKLAEKSQDDSLLKEQQNLSEQN